MRLIDADNILDFIDNAIKTAHGIGLRPAAALYLKKRIEDEPTIDPVRHGRWVREHDTGASMLMCSACEARVIEQAFYNATGTKGRSYCPNCGAKMEET